MVFGLVDLIWQEDGKQNGKVNDRGFTSFNIQFTLRRSSGLAYEKTQSAYGLCAFFLRHIFAVAGMLRIPLSQLQKRRKLLTLCEIGANFFEKYVV
jgi:hypothetical protein